MFLVTLSWCLSIDGPSSVPDFTGFGGERPSHTDGCQNASRAQCSGSASVRASCRFCLDLSANVSISKDVGFLHSQGRGYHSNGEHYWSEHWWGSSHDFVSNGESQGQGSSSQYWVLHVDLLVVSDTDVCCTAPLKQTWSQGMECKDIWNPCSSGIQAQVGHGVHGTGFQITMFIKVHEAQVLQNIWEARIRERACTKLHQLFVLGHGPANSGIYRIWEVATCRAHKDPGSRSWKCREWPQLLFYCLCGLVLVWGSRTTATSWGNAKTYLPLGGDCSYNFCSLH